MDTDREIARLNDRIYVLESWQRQVNPMITKSSETLKNAPVLAAVPVSNSPTANGYVPFFINGQRINLLTGQ